MNGHRVAWLLAGAMLTLQLASAETTRTAISAPAGGSDSTLPGGTAIRYPLLFTENAGQWDASVLYCALQPSRSIRAMRDGMQVVTWTRAPRTRHRLPLEGPAPSAARIRQSVTSLRFAGASPRLRVEAAERAPGLARFYQGDDPARWREGVASYGRIVYRDAWDGVDVALAGRDGALEATVTVQPGGRLSDVRFAVSGMDGSALPLVRAWQRAGGTDIPGGTDLPVAAHAVRTPRGELAIAAAPRDPALPLQLALEFSTYFGGNHDDFGRAVIVDDDGNMTVAGITLSPNVPVVRGTGPSIDTVDVFLSKIADDGRTLLFSTYIGGGGQEIDVQAEAGAAASTVLIGTTASVNFPLTAKAALTSKTDHFICRVDSGGALIYSSYLWDDGLEEIYGMTTDLCGYVYIVADTKDFITPSITMPNALFYTNQGIEDLFIMKLNPACDTMLYSTCLGGPAHEEANSIAVDREGNIVTVGTTYNGDGYPTVNAVQAKSAGQEDVVVTKIRADGRAIIFSTFLGGSTHEVLSTQPFENFVAMDDAGNTYVTGVTRSANFPRKRAMDSTLAGSIDVFLAKFSPTGELLFSTLLGGSNNDYVTDITVDACGRPAVCGRTLSRDFPLRNSRTAMGDSYIALFDSSGSQLDFSTLWGSPFHHSITLKNGFLHIVGTASIYSLPIFNAWQDQPIGGNDAFLSRINVPSCQAAPPTSRLTVSISAVDSVSVEHYSRRITPSSFTVSALLRNVGSVPISALTAKIKLPAVLALDPPAQPAEAALPRLLPGDSARCSWTVAVDTSLADTGISVAVLVSSPDLAAEHCLTSWRPSISIPVHFRSDLAGAVSCATLMPHTLAVDSTGLGYTPNPFPVTVAIRNTSPVPMGVKQVRLVLPPGEGLAAVPPGDTLRGPFTIAAGQKLDLAWSVLASAATRARTAWIAVDVVDFFDGTELRTCRDSIVIPALVASQCAMEGDTLRSFSPVTGRLAPDSLYVIARLQNVLDSAQAFLGAELDLTRAPHIIRAGGDPAILGPFTVAAKSRKVFGWWLRAPGTFTTEVRDTVVFRYRNDAGEEGFCQLVVRFVPRTINLTCALYGPTALALDTSGRRYASNPFPLICVVRNGSTWTIADLTAELRSSDSAAARVAPPARQRLNALKPGESDTLLWTVTALTSPFERGVAFTVAVMDTAGKTHSSCAKSVAIPAVKQGALCRLFTLDTIRYDRDNDVFIPDPFTATFELENRLDTAMTGVEAEVRLGRAPHLVLAAGETARKDLGAIAAHATARSTWLLRIVNPDSSMMVEQVDVCYRTAADTAWHCCSMTITIEPRKKNILILCETMGHDTVWTDAANGGCIPLPIQLRYTIRNRGSVPLTFCSAAILPPAGYVVMPGTDSVQTYENIMPQMDRSREWLLGLDPARARRGKDSVRWVWGCQGMRLDTSCVHEVTLLDRPPDGLVFTPWVLRFRARQYGPLPRAQRVRLWTGRGLAVPWQLQPDMPWLDVAPASGDTGCAVDARPNTTALALGEYTGAIDVTARSPMFRSSIEAIYVVDDTTSGVAAPADAGMPALVQSYPNPARGAATVVFRLPAHARATLALHDVLGRRVAELADAELDAGEHRVSLDAARIAPGVYILVLRAQGRTATRIVTIE